MTENRAGHGAMGPARSPSSSPNPSGSPTVPVDQNRPAAAPSARATLDSADGTPAFRDHLERAAERLLRTHENHPIVAGDRSLLVRSLDDLFAGLEAALQGESYGFPSNGLLVRRSLLEAVRSEVVLHWSEDDGSLLPLMWAFEALAGLLTDKGEGRTLAASLEPSSRNTLREVAHLLRSPMGSIVMIADTLREGQAGPLNAEQKRQVGIIHRAALAVAATAGDLLTHLGDIEDETDGTFTVVDVLAEVVHVIGPVAEARGCEVTIVQCADGERRGPRLGLTRILLAIAVRAVGLTRDATVELGCAAEGDEVRFTVRARGLEEPSSGPTTDLLRIFRSEPDSAVPMLSPHGLGLSAAASLLASLGTEMVIESPARHELLLTFAVPLPPAG